jgi:hypothetical protein
MDTFRIDVDDGVGIGAIIKDRTPDEGLIDAAIERELPLVFVNINVLKL